MMKKNFLIAIVLFTTAATAQEYKSFPMWNYKLPLEQRVNDVVSRLSLEEKVAQMLNAAPAIPRLGSLPTTGGMKYCMELPEPHSEQRFFHRQSAWQQHGIPTHCTVWPIILPWKEGPIHNKAIELGRTNERYLGLTYWTPNINIFS
jgi:beta-glucosidase